MTEKHKVRFEPVGIEIEVDENQTILRAAAEQGIMLMHGCKEGQCASCKSFVLEGDDIEHDRYSTFALPDYEKEEGYTLLCRAHAYEDVTIELLNYDADMIRSGLPIQQAIAEVVSKDPVTHDLRHLVLRLISPGEVKFFPGQYMDITVPGTGQVRSFSMANTSSRGGLLEFVIKVYPDGLFSEFLDQRLAVGDRLELTGPFGVFTLRESDSELVFVGGGAGMAPILSLLRSMAERGIHRKATFFYGARTQRDLCFEEELRAIADKLPNFTYIPALSHEISRSGAKPAPDREISDISPDGRDSGTWRESPAGRYGAAKTSSPDGRDSGTWTGETGLITDVVKRLTGGLGGAHAYVCGPPPMVEAAIPLLETLGVPDKRVYYDKFTTTGEPS
jgi:propane monooxygenase reductase subunit